MSASFPRPGDAFGRYSVLEELGRGDANVRSIVSVHLGLVAGVITRMGTEEQKQQWLPQMATGEVLACFGLTEPDFGSDAGNLQATAVKTDSGGYRLNGRKIFITNGSIAGLCLFYPKPAAGADPARMHVLMPAMKHGGEHSIHRHVALLVFDAAHIGGAGVGGGESEEFGVAPDLELGGALGEELVEDLEVDARFALGAVEGVFDLL